MHKQLGMAFEDQSVDEHRANPTRVALIYFNAGGGHRAAATALQSELARQCPGWAVSLVDLFAVLDPQQRFKRMTGFAPETYYNKRLSTGFTLGLAQELRLLQAMIRMAHTQLVTRLEAYWRMTEPDLVVSLVPNFNRAIGQSIKQALPQVPYVTVMTDMADYPPHFWVEPGYTEHLVCGTTHAVQQALSQGISYSQIHQVSGMLLSPRFYKDAEQDRATVRAELGFGPEDKVGLVMFGGHGSVAMKRIAAQLADRPLILACGRNESLQKSLAKLSTQTRHHVLGFTPDIARYMRIADYFIGKPGPGSVSEALHCGLPVIVTRNAWTMPQERWNTDWVQTHGLGCVLPSFANIDQAVDELLGNLEHFRSNVTQLTNRALFEVPVVLRSVLAEQGQIRNGLEIVGRR
ncbi:MAG: glycosyltransferase [Burkholderiaceae bacterium]|nr:glycosyltransferase [Burkholderiaceae bacterium]